MMKKLVILMVLLGMAASANASLVFNDNTGIGGSVTDLGLGLYIDAADSSEYTWYIVAVDNTLGTLSPGTEVLGNLTDDKTTYYPTYYMNPALVAAGLDPLDVSSVYGVIADSSGGPLVGTAVIDIGFTHIAGQVGEINLYASPGGDAGTWVITDTIYVAPEPMTMALLGLGGLFLRRRK
jgi:hypothetical protein